MVKETYNVYYKAFKELNEIIKFFPRNEYKKIPKSFIDFIEGNMDKSYEYIVEHVDDFQNQEMLEETKVLLSIIYRDFIASPDEKKQIIRMEKKELLKEEKRIQEKYNPDKLFEKMGAKVEKEQDSIVEYKESIFIKLKKWLKRVFNR
mgnify:CR=1 FL=1